MSAATAVDTRLPDSPENPHAGQGSVLLDIGGDIGALVVTTPASMVGVEVEIGPEGTVFGHHHHHDHHDEHPHLAHVAVVRRPVQGGEVPALVFGELSAGRYALAEKGTSDVRLVVDVRGGEVTSADWPDS